MKSQPLETVKYVDLDRYMGKWYEIAAFPQRFQKGCFCSAALYEMTNKGYVKITNSCFKGSTKGKLAKAEGKAFIVKGSNNAKLKVQFFWPFKGDYWIIDLADDYSYAVVGNESRKYLWILCRNSKMDKKVYEEIVERAKNKGFDISKLKLTIQECTN